MDAVFIDILNAFIQTRFKEKNYMAIINIRGLLVDILWKNYSDYKAYVTKYNWGVKQLLIICWNSLYVTMVARLL